MLVNRSRTGVRSNSALVCTLRTLTFHKVCEPMAAKQSFGGQGETVPHRRCELSASEENEAIFDCTGGVKQRTQLNKPEH